MSAADRNVPDDVGVDYDPGPEEKSAGVFGAKQRHEDELMALPEVTGVGVGQNEIGEEAIIVYVQHQSAMAQLPKEIDGYDVVAEVTGIIDAQ